jgi:serine/threonine-protein kinase
VTNQAKKRIGDYEILNELGQGGMGKVYRVRNIISDRVEAMKILLPELAGRQELAARFLREIKLVASLDHPNIGALRTALMLDDQLVMIMEYVEGTSLDDRLKQGPFPIAEALDYTDQVLRALSYAHKRGVVHRDIKPANMMLTAEGVMKVMDFGIAFSGSEQKLTSTGTSLGSLPYMSPEQVKGEGADPRSDLYSLGISLYEMVTGRRPFAADSDFAIMTAHIKETPRPPIELQPGLPASVNAVILQALSKEKEQRFQSADEFRDALSRVAAAGETVVFTPSSVMPGDVRKPRTSYSQSPAEPAPAMVAAPTPEVPPQPPQPARQGGHRALYMSLGAFLALVLLIVAGTYYRSGAAGSRQDQMPVAPVSKEVPAAKPVAGEAEPTADASGPAVELDPRPVPVEAAQKAPPSQATTATVEPQEKPVEQAEAAPGNSAQLDELEQQLDQLTSRVFAVESSLETLRQQQRAAGYGLRGDITAKWQGMKLNLAKAQQALANGDVARGKRYADKTQSYVGQLERFLGR